MLIVRLGAMGDVLHALPAVTALRLRHPDWFLGWVVEPRWAPLLRACEDAATQTAAMPLVDRLHTAHARGWARAPLVPGTWREILKLRTELRAEHYDLCIDLQGAIRSAAIARMAGTDTVVGEAEPRERVARWLFKQRVPTRGVHVIEQAIEVVEEAVGEPLVFLNPELPRDAEAEQWADQHVRKGARILLINPGAGWGAKRWPPDRFGAVARVMAGEGIEPVVNAGPGEEAIAQEVAAASGGRARALSMTINQLIALTRRAALVIAGDTGPLHLACALAKPVVGVFGPTDPARNGPFGVCFRVLRHPGSKRDHSRRGEPEAGLLTISAEDVVQAAHDVLRESAVHA